MTTIQPKIEAIDAFSGPGLLAPFTTSKPDQVTGTETRQRSSSVAHGVEHETTTGRA